MMGRGDEHGDGYDLCDGTNTGVFFMGERIDAQGMHMRSGVFALNGWCKPGIQ